MLCDAFGLYPSFVAGVLKHTVEINFYVPCNYRLKYSDYIQVNSVIFLVHRMRKTVSCYRLLQKLLY